MFLFKLSQGVNNDYDTYGSCVVVAKDPGSAKVMVPYNPAFDDDDGDDGDDYSYRTQAWASVEDVKVECVGVASAGLREGQVICASFRAG